MAARDINEMLNQQDVRVYWQPGGPDPENPVYLAGLKGGGGVAGYIDVTGITEGGSTVTRARRLSSSQRGGKYVQTMTTTEAPEDNTASFAFYFASGILNRHQVNLRCAHSFYLAAAKCKPAYNLLQGYESWVFILERGLKSGSIDYGDFVTNDGADGLTKTVPFNFEDMYFVGTLNFARQLTTAATPIVAVAYGNKEDCGECGPNTDGTKIVYLAKAAATGAKPTVVYTTSGSFEGTNATTLTINSAALDETIVDLKVIGDTLVAFSGLAGGGIHYTPILRNGKLGVTDPWVKSATGFSGLTLKEAFVDGDGLNPSANIFMIAQTATTVQVLKMTGGAYTNAPTVLYSKTVTTGNALRIHGSYDGRTIVGVHGDTGSNGEVIYSLNGGSLWSTYTPDLNFNIQSVFVKSDHAVFLGGATTALAAKMVKVNLRFDPTDLRSVNIGAAGSATIGDVKFVTPSVGYFVLEEGMLYATLDGGRTWSNSVERVQNFPVSVFSPVRIAAPVIGETENQVNNVIVTGAGATSNGVVVIGASTIG